MKLIRSWTFKWWEVGVIKVCLLSLGILLGLYFSVYLADLIWLWWLLFIATAAYFIIKFFREA